MKRILTLAGLCAVAIAALLPRIAAANPQDFAVPSATNNSTFKLSEAKGKYVVLHFLLKTECPYCLAHTRKYFTEAPKLPNVVQVFLKPDSMEDIKAWTRNLPPEDVAKYPIYRDADAKLANEFGIPDGYKFHGQVVHYPALVLLNPAGKEVFRYVGKNNTDRFAFEQLKAKVEELEKAK